ncbi:MAG: hypothetical protein Q4B18_08375 [Bacillota bacterium]|nr:hypothetical protein [Bacillota bacterium]
MDQIMNFVILAVVLIVLGVIVVYSLMHRAKHDPESFENKFFRDFDLYDAQASRGGTLIAKRADRPAYPDINDPKYTLAWAIEKQAEEKMKQETLEDLELWEEEHR